MSARLLGSRVAAGMEPMPPDEPVLTLQSRPATAGHRVHRIGGLHHDRPEACARQEEWLEERD